MAHFSFIDLFSGIGGFRLTLESLGGKCIGFSEIAPDAIRAYCGNFGESEGKNFGDITQIRELPAHDFLTAGVPCQSWSIAGKNLGFDDDRGQLWNDTLFLLNKTRPKAFIFENVKGLADPRNSGALSHIMRRIEETGFHARKYLLNASDYGSPQTRVRIYIVGFKERRFLDRLAISAPRPGEVRLGELLDGYEEAECRENRKGKAGKAGQSLARNPKGFNSYFLFNDIRNGGTTIHSWDIADTTEREKHICLLLLNNRRKRLYGPLDGNPLSLGHFKEIDSSITKEELEGLVEKRIFKHVRYLFRQTGSPPADDTAARLLLATAAAGTLNISVMKNCREVKKRKVNVRKTVERMLADGIIRCTETRYEFKNTKISTGLSDICRVFLPSCDIFPTLVASDTNDYVATKGIETRTLEEYRTRFMEEVFLPQKFRKITQAEACRLQGFPADYPLPPARARWMKLIGNSVAVPVVRTLAEAVVGTGVFG